MEEVKENHKRKPLAVKWNLRAILYLLLPAGGVAVYLLLSVMIENKITSFYQPRHIYHNPGHDYTIKTEGCYIPEIEPFSEAVRRFYVPKDSAEHDKWKCTNTPPLLERNRTHVWVSKETLSHYNITDNNDLSCCSQAYYRPDKVENVWDFDVDDRVKYENCVNFTDSIQVMHEFLKVTCYVQEEPVYTNMYLFAQKKNSISYKITNSSSYNVIVLGINSVSRLNFHRTMPKTLRFLYDKGAVELLGYTTVGQDLFSNIAALLIAKEAAGGLNETCLPYIHATLDSCFFVWNEYKKYGYYTAFAEDFDGIFNNRRADGFFRKPTEYYTHTYTMGIPSNYRRHCINERYFYEIILDYLEDLLWTLKTFDLFGVFWSGSLSRNDLNAPTLMDAGYFNFLKRLDSSDFLKSTVIVLVSDHGYRYGDIRITQQGHSEHRLPFAFLLMPPSFKRNYSIAFDNLILNSDRLTSPYDIRATLMDLRSLATLTNSKIVETQRETEYEKQRGISLFLPIPGNRTCALAGIPEEWCVCTHRDEVWSKTENVTNAAAVLMAALKEAVRSAPLCAPLALERVEQALERMGAWQRELRLVLRTRPGGGLFEGTLRAHGGQWQLSSLDRINRYGDQSRCVRDRNLIPYCHCNITEPEEVLTLDYIKHNMTMHNMMIHNMTMHNMMIHNMKMHNMTMHNMTMHNMTMHNKTIGRGGSEARDGRMYNN